MSQEHNPRIGVARLAPSTIVLRRAQAELLERTGRHVPMKEIASRAIEQLDVTRLFPDLLQTRRELEGVS
jgi:hypothetical protein